MLPVKWYTHPKYVAMMLDVGCLVFLLGASQPFCCSDVFVLGDVFTTWTREKQETLPPAEKDKSLFEEYSQTRSVSSGLVRLFLPGFLKLEL